jgi:hypothetical protein
MSIESFSHAHVIAYLMTVPVLFPLSQRLKALTDIIPFYSQCLEI